MNKSQTAPITRGSSKCPKCGKEFHCNPSGKCWCGDVNVAPDKLTEISRKYDTCLCPECLKNFTK